VTIIQNHKHHAVNRTEMNNVSYNHSCNSNCIPSSLLGPQASMVKRTQGQTRAGPFQWRTYNICCRAEYRFVTTYSTHCQVPLAKQLRGYVKVSDTSLPHQVKLQPILHLETGPTLYRTEFPHCWSEMCRRSQSIT
jgi:hypothetical protein